LADPAGREGPRPVELECVEVIKRLALSGPAEARLVWGVFRLLRKNPALAEVLPWYLVHYMQVRHTYERGGIWKSRSRSVRAVHRWVLGALSRFQPELGMSAVSG
jgi:hypothetical protein